MYTRNLESLVLFSVLLTGIVGRSQVAPGPVVRVTVTRVSRHQQGLVEFEYVVNNSTNSDVYIPAVTIDKIPRIHSLHILLQRPNSGWVRLGPHYDLAASVALCLRPGESRTFVDAVSDPSIIPLPGEGVPIHQGESVSLGGRAKIRIGFYSSEAEWLAYRRSVQRLGRKNSENKNPHELRFIESDDFEVPTKAGGAPLK